MPPIRAAVGIATALLGASLAAVSAQAPKPAEGTAMIVGHVLGQNGEPLRDTEVWALAPDAPDVVVRRVRTDGEGLFVLSRLASNALTVRARAPGMTTATIDTWELANAPSICVDLRLWEARTLRGRILDPEGKPIAGASLVAAKDFSTLAYVPPEGTTDAQGCFELRGAPIGRCVLRAIAPGFEFNGHIFEDVFDEAIDLRLARGDGVQLRITTQGLSREQAAATQVCLRANAWLPYRMPPSIERQPLGADGTLTIKGLPETAWKVSLQHPTIAYVPREATVACSKKPEPVRFTANVAPAAIFGQVLVDGWPLAGHTLVLRTTNPAAPAREQRTWTDFDGSFEFGSQLPVGETFQLRLAANDWRLARPGGSTVGVRDVSFLGCVAHATPDVGLDLDAVRATPLRGKVVDSRGDPVPLIAVELQFQTARTAPLRDRVKNWRTTLRTTSGRDGTFQFDGLPPVSVLARLCARNATAASDCLPFLCRDAAIEQTIVLGRAGSIAGVLRDDDGEPIPGATIVSDGEDTTAVMTDFMGRFVFLAVTPGAYQLATQDGSTTRVVDPMFEVRSGETVRRELTWQ